MISGLGRRRSVTHPRYVRALIAAVVAVASAAPRASAHSFIWKATSPDHHVVYLVGSVHLLTKDFYPLSPALDAAFKDSDLLVEEADMGQMLGPSAQLELLTRGMLTDGRTLDQVISPAAYDLVTKRSTALGLPMAAVDRFKPWMAALTLLGLEWQKAGFDPTLGLDKHFYDLAATAKMPVQGLETVDYQLARFDGMTAEQQEKMLTDTLKELDTEKGNVAVLADAWKAGDAPTVERLVVSDLKQDPAMYQRLLVERNRNWFPKLQALFARAGHAFVVVGAAHLVGPDGLLAMLQAKGYTIEQL
ncbi:MAG: TraB/GumN family protein [Betaproteobacteria bacterium]